jgi:aldose 1-epimerase
MTKVTATVGPSRHERGANAMRMMALGAVLAGVLAAESASAAGSLEHAPYGTTRGGQAVEIFTMTNNRGMRVRFLSYGGVITEIDVPDRAGRVDNIALGQRGLLEYETLLGHFGAITGRYANRIGGAQFTLNEKTYHLIANNGANTLHGGPNALDHRVWTVVPAAAQNGVAAVLTYISKDGDQNFPGTLTTKVVYTLTDDSELRIDYTATTDKYTVVNFTNHTYFNLAGNGSGSVADQLLLINADRYTPTGPDQIPTGEIAPVDGTPLDFRQMTPIGARLHSAFQQMVYAHGYDHNWVLNKREGDGLTFAARGYDPRTGRVVDCLTTEPAVQVYTANGLNGSLVGSSGTTYRQTDGFTLETQHFPDSPNKPNFPTTELRPGQEFHSTTVYRFSSDTALPPVPR